MAELEKRVMRSILSGEVKMIQGLIDLKFLDPKHDVYNFTGGDSGTPEDCYLALELIAARYNAIPNYKEMIDLFLSNGVHIDDHAGVITPLEQAMIHKNFPVAAYLQYKGGTYNVEEIKIFGKVVEVDLIEEVMKEINKLMTA